MGELGRRTFLLQVAALGLGEAYVPRLAWAQGSGLTPSGDRFETMRPGELPSFAAKASPKVQEAYRYAAANGETLKYFPCFCGCENIGHRHNADCYIKERHRDGRITYTSHSAT
jgi:hypothetical protein